MKCIARLLAALLCVAMAAPGLMAQPSEDTPFSKEQIEQIVAPIALYPDGLVAQVLMASTYPLEVVSAARWVKANKGVTGKALEEAMQKQPWDPSVKALTAFPQVLEMMNSKLDWTQQLGDAFLAQQKEVMAAVQTLRARADSAGNLKSSPEQVVTKEQQGSTTIVKIEPANPEVVYVPTYNPTVVYGAWPYPASPPYYYYPPGYAPGAALLTFGVGMAVGAALWGDCDWRGGDVNINASKYNNFNRTNVKGGNWQHQVEHRKGVGYRDNASREKFGRGQQPGAENREQFRGRAEAGRRDLSSSGADRMKQDGPGQRGGIGDSRGGERRDGGMRQTSATREAGGLDGVGGRGTETRSFSDRGAASRASPSGASRASAGAAPRAGGGARAGGGGGGGRGGGGRR